MPLANRAVLVLGVAAWLGAVPAARSVELAAGDLVVADASGRIVRVDPATGDQELVASGGSLVDPVGLAIAPDGMLWTANRSTGQLVRIDPSDGSQTPVFSGSIAGPRDLEFLSDGTLWVLGDGLWKVAPGPPVVVTLEEPDIGGIASGRAFALVESGTTPGVLAAAAIAVGGDGARAYAPDAMPPFYDPFLLPSPPDASVNGVALLGGLPLVTQSRLSQLFFCESIGGVYMAIGATVAQIAAGSPFRCPRHLAIATSPDFDTEPPTGSYTAYVTDVDVAVVSPGPPRIVAVDGAADLSSADAATLASGVLLEDPWDVEVVPEPGRVAAALLAIATLAGLRRCGGRGPGARRPGG